MGNNGSGKGLSVASLVLGICGLVVPYVGFLCALIGLILGVVGKNKSKSIGEPTGMATAGIVLSIIGLVGAVLLMVLCGGLLASLASTASY